jgi:hypothetical protein
VRDLPPRPVRDLPPRPVRDLPPRPVREATGPAAVELPEGVSRDLVVALARELAAEMARSNHEARPAPNARPARSDARPSKPDARPMRFVYGAGAVAAMSVMAVGLVQPDFAATADQNNVPDATADPNAVAQVPADVAVRHVTQYVHLQPGQTAPPGATVIAADAPTPQVVVTHNQPANPPAAQPAARPPAPAPRTRQSGKPKP